MSQDYDTLPSGLLVPKPPAPKSTAEEQGWTLTGGMDMPEGHTAKVWHHLQKWLTGIVSVDAGRWHLSVSHRERIPTWGELGFARDCLLPPDVWLMIPHPPREHWLNLNPRVLHLWEFRDRMLIAAFSFEGRMARQEDINTPDDGGGIPEPSDAEA